MTNPRSTSMRRATAASRYRLRRCKTSRRWSRNACNASFRFITRGTPSGSITLRLSGTRTSSSVSRNSCSISTSGSTLRFFGSRTTRTSLADSSRMSASSGSFFSSSSAAIFSISRLFGT